MNKGDYLSELHRYLAAMPRDERDSAMRFYMEYFDDAGADNEQAVMLQLGTPRQLADQLLGEMGASTLRGDAPRPARKRHISAWMWVLIGLASPLLVMFGALAFGLAVLLLAVAFMLLLCVLMLAFMPLLVGAILALGGVYVMGNGVLVIWQHFPTALFFIGSGLVCTAGGALLFRPSLHVLQAAARWTFKCSGWLTQKFRRLRIQRAR